LTDSHPSGAAAGKALPRVAVSIGDPSGIGPEIALKAALDQEVQQLAQPVLFGDAQVLETHSAACGLAPKLRVFTEISAACRAERAAQDEVFVLHRPQFSPGELVLGAVRAAHGRSAIDSAKAAIESALQGLTSAVVAAPQTETAIKAAGIAFDGYPSFVARCTGVPEEDAFLMICFEDVRIAHATLHVSLRHALDLITTERLARLMRTTAQTLRQLNIPSPRLAVSGLNPHASEGGLFGAEEAEVISPALRIAQSEGIMAEGPFGADTMFHRKGYDAYLVMLHDQGHIAAKLLARNRTAGMTIGTPIIFSSVAHGSALDIAGRGLASPAAVIEAIRRVTGAAQSNPTRA
jgi:4-hydroxythreonine-4-phosphate dehydrogenase